MSASADGTAGNALDRSSSAWALFLKGMRRVLREPLGLIGVVLVSLIIVSAIGADWFAPYDAIKINVRDRMLGPSLEHLIGTDQLGRDLFSRVLVGGRIALYVALLSIGLAMLVGVGLGMLAGFGPRWLDAGLMFVFDTLRSFPTIMFALAVVTIVGPSLETVVLIVVATQIPVYGRVCRTQTLALKNTEFILAERAMGVGTLRIMTVHLLPNVIGPLLILASMDIPFVVTIEAGLSFLGMGVRPPTPSWGSILNDGYSFIDNTPWPVLAGGIPLVLTTLGFTFLGETLRDTFDPKLRRDIR